MIKELETIDVLKKRYRVRKTGKDGRSLETTLPREVFEREARRRGYSLDEALERLVAVWHYDSFEGLLLLFEEIEKSAGE